MWSVFRMLILHPGNHDNVETLHATQQSSFSPTVHSCFLCFVIVADFFVVLPLLVI